jgi:hypothetical protein
MNHHDSARDWRFARKEWRLTGAIEKSRDVKRQFLKEVRMANKHIKKSLIIKEIQMKTSLSIHLTPFKWQSSRK